ncbi:MAG: hypothetical protein ACI9VR_004062, partial [Cognaticolwellia sp.]
MTLFLTSLACLSGLNAAHAQDAPRRFAVVVGVSQAGSSPELALEGAGSDATRVALALREQAGYTDVRIITDAEATKERILKTFQEDLALVVTEQDTLLVYFVGHGVGGDFDEPYLLPYDTDPLDVPGTAISVAELGAQLSQWVPAASYAIVTDAAHQGAVGDLALLGPAATSWPDMGASTMLLSASGLGSPAVPGVFSKHFIDAITGGADTSRDGIVSVAELYRYLVIAVPAETGGSQQPAVGGRYDQELALATDVTFKDLLAQIAVPEQEV